MPHVSPVVRGLADLRAAAIGGHTGMGLEAAVVAAAMVAAFLLGYFHAAAQPVDGSWAQIHMTAAVNFACTGHFGPLRLAPDATVADAAALEQVLAFLRVHRPDLSCDLLPQHLVATSFRDGFDTGNAELPVYLMLLFGTLWRWFGLNWHLTVYVIGATVAASFLCIYVCARPFMPVLVAAIVALLFLMSPLFIANVVSPRDALKFPFAITIAALLVTAAAVPRGRTSEGAAPPRAHPASRLVLLAAAIGTVIGIGYGFRSDILIFLVPAVAIVCAVGETGPVGWMASLSARAAALAALLSCFAIAGWLPLYNDYVAHPSFANIGFHQVASGLFGTSRMPLFQSQGLDGGMYMFRNGLSPDIGTAVRVIEFASRKFGETVGYAPGAGPYWTYSRAFFMDVVRLIPADLISGAIGSFIRYMTLPSRQGTFVSFVLNLAVTFIFLVRITRKFGYRAAIATVLVVGTTLAVTSLRFESRHMFYVYVFALLAWTSTIVLLLHAVIARADIDRGPAVAVASPMQAARLVATLVVGAALAVFGALWIARIYQANVLHGLIVDWSNRARVPASYRISDRGPGTSLIQVSMPMPLSTGGLRSSEGSPITGVQMGVVAVAFDGKRCADREVAVTALSEPVVSDPNADFTALKHIFGIVEPFSLRVSAGHNYVAYLPAFFFQHDDGRGNNVPVTFTGIELDRANVPCVSGVSYITEFKKSDVLFDFFVPADPSAITRDDLFQRVRVPGTKFFL